MESFWSEEAVKWYYDAANYTGYFRHLADRLEHYLKPEDRILDLGCGPGFLVDELNRRGYHARGVDCCQWAMSHWQHRCAAESRPFPGHQIDLFAQVPETLACDVVIATHFGRTVKDFAYMLNIPAERYIFVKNLKISQSLRGRHRSTGFDLQYFLEEAGIPYRWETVKLDFSQPMGDLESVERFKKFYGLSKVRLTEGEGPMPYLIRKQKEMMILCAAPRHLDSDKDQEGVL